MEYNFFDISTKNRIVLAGNINLSSVFLMGIYQKGLNWLHEKYSTENNFHHTLLWKSLQRIICNGGYNLHF